MLHKPLQSLFKTFKVVATAIAGNGFQFNNALYGGIFSVVLITLHIHFKWITSSSNAVRAEESFILTIP